MDYAMILLGIAAVHLLAVASPGPTLVVVTSYAAGGDRRAGFLVTLGVVLATLTWSSLAAAGLGAVMSGSSWAYTVVQLAGAAYLVYLGARLLIAATRQAPVATSEAKSAPVSGWAAVRAGYLTNMTNPKVIAYYASLFGVMIPHDAPRTLFLAAACTAIAMSAVWWSSVTLFFSLPVISRGYARLRPKMDVAMGGILILLGLRLALSR